jgi:uncharacterized phage protein (TIGR02220 family)
MKMAQDKKSFVLYSDSQGLVNQLPDEIAGRLLKHIYAYVNDENPISDELLLNIAFEPIKMQLKRDLLKWEGSKESKSINGKMGNLKRYNLDIYNDVLSNKITLEQAENLAKSRKVSQGDSPLSPPIAKLAVNDNVNVNVNVINKDNNLSVNWDALLLQFNSITGKKMRVVCPKTKKQVTARLKEGYTKQDLVNAITNCFNDDFHKDNPHFLTLEFISRSEKMQKYSQDIKKSKPKQQDRL